LGERAVYELLSRLPSESGFAVHSVNLPEHLYKRWAEADYVIVEASGVTLLEVKGGTVTIAGREWRYENARGNKITSNEGPARQAVSAAVALESLLERHLERKIRCRWGVVFPLCRFKKKLVELPPERLADIITCRDVEMFGQWLRGIPYDPHNADAFTLDQDEIDAIHRMLLPEMCAFASLGLALRSNSSEVLRLTDQQFTILESLQSNPRLNVTGGAGTGKTELAALCARGEKAAGRTPALVTAGGPLLHQLRSKMMQYGIPVVTEILPAGTDMLIVDEGQDLTRPEPMDVLFSQLPGGLSNGYWRWFMDPNLQFMEDPPDPLCLRQLHENSTAVTLTRNVRTTREIVTVIRSLLEADVGISKIDGFGTRVGLYGVADAREEIEVASAHLRGAMEDGVQPSEIAVLGPEGTRGPVCGALIRQFPGLLGPLFSVRRPPAISRGVACGITDFRGMEAGLVLLVDLDLLPQGRQGISHLYIGMSRSRASLRLMLSPGMRSYLKHLITQQV